MREDKESEISPRHPWHAFLLARKDAITWLIEEGDSPEKIARTLSIWMRDK